MDCVLIRHGGKHDCLAESPKMKISQPIPRHREIRECLAKHIIQGAEFVDARSASAIGNRRETP